MEFQRQASIQRFQRLSTETNVVFSNHFKCHEFTCAGDKKEPHFITTQFNPEASITFLKQDYSVVEDLGCNQENGLSNEGHSNVVDFNRMKFTQVEVLDESLFANEFVVLYVEDEGKENCKIMIEEEGNSVEMDEIHDVGANEIVDLHLREYSSSDSIDVDEISSSESTSVLGDKIQDQSTQYDVIIPLFSIENFIKDDAAVEYYTGFGDYRSLMKFFQFLNPGEMFKELSLKNQLFLTLIKLKQGADDVDLGFRFGVSTEHVVEVVVTWVNFMYEKFGDMDSLVMISGYLSQVKNKYKILSQGVTECTLTLGDKLIHVCFKMFNFNPIDKSI